MEKRTYPIKILGRQIGIQSTEVINAVCSLDPSLLDAGACAPSLHAMMFGTHRPIR